MENKKHKFYIEEGEVILKDFKVKSLVDIVNIINKDEIYRLLYIETSPKSYADYHRNYCKFWEGEFTGYIKRPTYLILDKYNKIILTLNSLNTLIGTKSLKEIFKQLI